MGKVLKTLVVLLIALAWGQKAHADDFRLLERSRTETSLHSGQYQVIEKIADLDPKQTALVICDLWDKHWCEGANSRVAQMAPRIDALAKAMRAKGSLIVHAPSDTMKYYEGTVQRRRALEAPTASTPVEFHWNYCDPANEPPLPI